MRPVRAPSVVLRWRPEQSALLCAAEAFFATATLLPLCSALLFLAFLRLQRRQQDTVRFFAVQ
jgi:hypothetical protein